MVNAVSSHLNFCSCHRRKVCVSVGCHSGWISAWFSLGDTLVGVLWIHQRIFPFGFNSVWEVSVNYSKLEGLVSIAWSCLCWVQDMPRLLAFSFSHKIWVWDIFKFIVLIWFSVENWRCDWSCYLQVIKSRHISSFGSFFFSLIKNGHGSTYWKLVYLNG